VTGASVKRAGQLIVHLVDALAAPIPEVSVVIAAKGRQPKQVLSDARGRVVFSELKDGSYTVTAKLAGFAEATASLVRVRRSCLAALTMPLRVIDITD
jgi:hypothetical protein